MDWAEVAGVVSTHAQSYDVVGLEWIGKGGGSTAEVAPGVRGEDAVTFVFVLTGVRVGSLSVGVAPVLAAARSVRYGWGITEETETGHGPQAIIGARPTG
jgi:hypothetical protein